MKGSKMERLTSKAWRNLDPWECCGQDYYCKRDCHEEGGCANGCVVPRLYSRLARYEDLGLLPEEIDELLHSTAGPLHRRDDRLVILPVNLGDDVYYLTSAPALAVGRPTRVEKSICRGFYFDEKGLQICLNWDVKGSHGTYGWWGKTIFATREEAEAAMKGITNAD